MNKIDPNGGMLAQVPIPVAEVLVVCMMSVGVVYLVLRRTDQLKYLPLCLLSITTFGTMFLLSQLFPTHPVDWGIMPASQIKILMTAFGGLLGASYFVVGLRLTKQRLPKKSK